MDERQLHTSTESRRIEVKQRELWIYIAVSIGAVELLIAVGALFFGIISGYAQGEGRIVFPFLSWAAASITIPAILLLCVHFVGVGLLLDGRKKNHTEEEWEKHLPEKIRKAYGIISRAPAVVLLGGIVVLGVGIFTLDGALSAVDSFLSIFKPYLLYILGGIAIILVIFGIAAVWLNFRTRKLHAEYEYRREVLEKTGIVIVDKHSLILQPGKELHGGYTPLTAAHSANRALLSAHDIDVSKKALPVSIDDTTIEN